MKYIKKCFYLLIMIAPQILSEYYNQEWQTRAVYLIGSVAIILLLNLESYEIFQISKDGVRIKKVLNEAKDTVINLKTMLETTLLLQTKQLIITGSAPKQITEQYDIIDNAIKSNDLQNKELRNEVKILRGTCLGSFITALNSCFVIMYDPKENESGRLSKRMIEIINSAYEKKNYPTPEELSDAFSEMKLDQKEFLNNAPNWKESYYDMYRSAEEYIEKYQEFYDKTK